MGPTPAALAPIGVLLNGVSHSGSWDYCVFRAIACGRTMPTVLDIKTSRALCLDVMRTTLTLDDDVAAILERLRKSRDASLKDLVNEALRRGLKDMTGRTKRRERLQTRSVALGRLRIASLDNIGEALAIAEGEAYK
jgi:Ribbon-helix-helix protein, copG family